MNRFLSSFYWAALGTLVAFLLALHLWWSHVKVGLPVRPPFAIDSTGYISDYGSSGSGSHYIDYFGLFGTGETLRRSDVLLVGSSHVVFGLSAAELSAALSEQAHHAVTVYNIGKPFADGVPFGAAVLQHNGLEHKTLIIDLFHFYGDDVSPLGKSVLRSNLPAAYYQVGNIWMTYACDWLLDPLLPRFTSRVHLDDAILFGHHAVKPSPLYPMRMLRGSSIRRWDTGDAIDLTDPNQNSLFENPVAGAATTYTITHEVNLPNAGIRIPPALQALRTDKRFDLIYTVVPYFGFEDGAVPAEAKPFIALSPDGLTFYDRAHLTSAGRHLATGQLAKALVDRNLSPH